MDVETRARQVSPGVVGWMMARHPWLRRPLGVGPADMLDPAVGVRPSGSGRDSDIGTGQNGTNSRRKELAVGSLREVRGDGMRL
jgi:hypothetical protein